MKLKISDYPSSYLAIELEEGEKIITEKGSMIYCDGEYKHSNKIEANNINKWIAKLIGGKSLTYNIYTALEPLKMALSTKDSSEIFMIDVEDENPISFEPELHFARTDKLEINLEKKDFKTTFNDGLKLKTKGSGKLFLKGYGKIIKHKIDTEKPIYVDEESLIAFEDKLSLKTISKGIKELVTSGEGFMYAIQGSGYIWLQSREKNEQSSSGGIVEGLFSLFR